MNIEVTHYIDNERHLVINASGPSFSYGAILSPIFEDGIPHIKMEDIDAKGIDDSKEVKAAILQAISTQRGKFKEESVIVDDYNKENAEYTNPK